MPEQCSFGCGKSATYIAKNGFNQCHYQTTKCPANKNKTKEEIYSVKYHKDDICAHPGCNRKAIVWSNRIAQCHKSEPERCPGYFKEHQGKEVCKCGALAYYYSFQKKTWRCSEFPSQCPATTKAMLKSRRIIDSNGLDTYVTGTAKGIKTKSNAIVNGKNTHTRGAERAALVRRADIIEGKDSYQRMGEEHSKRYWANYVIPDDLAKKDLYYHNVWQFTNQQDLKSLPNNEKRGTHDHHLDHKYSISQGYINNIPPVIIGHITNLEFIPAKANCSKQDKCSITKTQLLIEYNIIFNNNNSINP